MMMRTKMKDIAAPNPIPFTAVRSKNVWKMRSGTVRVVSSGPPFVST